ncbi:MarR family winged helix-turn-helix transcriptional regulator [Staphylococcus gallinarum]|uniref:MarR family winged helix-turn-helix transcriptional regulator n=1 Tax=Staphylococcus gallinarum TaxID=1293 RepID=UPI001E47857F|nr:MarR family winged helix-turn-helix transcriptional regulator [Staphylococcus gallinarum]MCD8898873.1 MarR family winged helix-turn-helix transcriptional regulator [Staphylococcus gallinarum]MCD8902062.1 MarR family winged helix-turn-helix transcriptional regulator [Staphylococcus gallinarum]MCD8919545.1 MarR family winged helix-turn-helix transcriptional regulator [Staphylococcus gallinarum]MEB6236730.1 MarR family winged helix-turn-helix transcriptional regulator [Staphylococcus gallinarum
MSVQTIRKFNRYYTRILGIFDKKVFNLNYSMIEMRILGEISRNSGITANTLTTYLDIDKSYLSRILDKLLTADYIYREKDSEDSRKLHIYLTAEGQKLNEYVETASNKKVEKLIADISPGEVKALEEAMETIENILGQVVSPDIEGETHK